MFPEYPKFKNLEFEDREALVKYFKNIHKNICEFSLANLLIWKAFDRPQITRINQNLCILINPLNEAPFFLEPLSKNKLVETVNICLDHCGQISRASENFIYQLPKDKFKFECMRNHFDYVYLTQKLADLKGKKYDGKRNHLKKFKRLFPEYKFITFEPTFKNEALNLFEEWFSIRKESRFFPRLAYFSQKKALETTCSNYVALNLAGGAVVAENLLRGFIIGSYLNFEMINVHFSYGHPALPGISQILLWEACNKTFAKAKYVNLEQDLGIPGLRKAKLSYYPLKLEKKFEIKK